MEIAVNTRCQSGEIWQLGNHRLLCGDSRDPEQVRTVLGGAQPQFVFADPPYGISIVGKKGTVGSDKPRILRARGEAARPNAKPLQARQYAPVIGDDSTDTAVALATWCLAEFPRAVQIWWGGNYYAHRLPPARCWVIWDKVNGSTSFADAEIAWTNQRTSTRICRHMWNGVCRASESGQKRVHPTQKPVALAKWCFERYGQSGDLIYDPCLGSGITILAAEETGSSVAAIELSPHYCGVAIERWERLTGRAAVRIH